MAATTTNQTLTPRSDNSRLLETVMGRMLELLVLSVEGIRERVSRQTAQ